MLRRILIASLLLAPTAAFATTISSLDVTTILTNLQGLLTPLMGLLLAISFLGGIIFLMKGIMKLKQMAQPITQMSQPGHLSGPLVYIAVGAVLIYIPSSTDVLTNTFFGPGALSIFNTSGTPDLAAMGQASDTLMGYAPISVEGQWAALVNTVVLYMEFIGFLAFLRGWFIIAHTGDQGSQPGTLSKGIIHIIGGILAINFLPLVQAISNTINGQ